MRLIQNKGGSKASHVHGSEPARIEPLERRVFLSATLDVVAGSGGVKSITYPTAGGATATIAVNGGGAATVHFFGDTIAQTTKNNAVTLAGTNIVATGVDGSQTTKNTVLKVTTKGGGGGTVSIG